MLVCLGCSPIMAQRTIYLDRYEYITENQYEMVKYAIITHCAEIKSDSVAFYSMDGQLDCISFYAPFTDSLETRVLHGPTIYKFRGSEQDSLICNYQKNKRVGKYTTYYFNGQVNLDRDFDNKGHSKLLKQYYPDGKLKRVEELGVDSVYYDEHGNQVLPYVPYEQKAAIVISKDELVALLAKEMKYPRDAQKAGVAGRVILQFHVTKEGIVDRIWVKKGVHRSLDREALRTMGSIVKKISFTPAYEDGKPVEDVLEFPLLYRLRGLNRK